MAEQRMVPVELLERILSITQPIAPAISTEIRSIIDGHGVEPVAWIHPMDVGRFPSVQFERLNDEMLPLYLASPSAPVQRLPEGCAWAVTKGGHSICQPPKSWDKQAPAQAVPDVEEIRRRFEQEYVVNPQTYRRNEYGDYVLPSIQDAWAGWKAAMLAAAPQPPATAQPSVACPTDEEK